MTTSCGGIKSDSKLLFLHAGTKMLLFKQQKVNISYLLHFGLAQASMK